MVLCCYHFSENTANTGLLTQLAPYITIFATIIIAILGWLVNARFNRKHEIFKKRIDLRITTLIEIQKLFYTFEFFSPKLNIENYVELSKQITVNLMICGNNSEIKLWYDFQSAYADWWASKEDAAKERKAWNVYLEIKKEFTDIIRKDIGTELLKK